MRAVRGRNEGDLEEPRMRLRGRFDVRVRPAWLAGGREEVTVEGVAVIRL